MLMSTIMKMSIIINTVPITKMSTIMVEAIEAMEAATLRLATVLTRVKAA